MAPRDADIPTSIVQSLFPLNDAVCYDEHELPVLVVQVTELSRDGGIFIGFACNHALSDGTAFWKLVNAWAATARARLTPPTSARIPPVCSSGGPSTAVQRRRRPCFPALTLRCSSSGCSRRHARADASLLGGVPGGAQGACAAGAPRRQ